MADPLSIVRQELADLARGNASVSLTQHFKQASRGATTQPAEAPGADGEQGERSEAQETELVDGAREDGAREVLHRRLDLLDRELSQARRDSALRPNKQRRDPELIPGSCLDGRAGEGAARAEAALHVPQPAAEGSAAESEITVTNNNSAGDKQASPASASPSSGASRSSAPAVPCLALFNTLELSDGEIDTARVMQRIAELAAEQEVVLSPATDGEEEPQSPQNQYLVAHSPPGSSSPRSAAPYPHSLRL